MQLEKIGGLAAITGLVLICIAILYYPGYSPLVNYLSDLGLDGPSSIFFNAGAVLAAISGLLLGISLYRKFNKIAIVFLLGSISLIGVGLFSEKYEGIHTFFSVGFFGLMAIFALYLGMKLKSLKIKISSVAVALSSSAFLISQYPIFEHIAALAIIIWYFIIGLSLKKK